MDSLTATIPVKELTCQTGNSISNNFFNRKNGKCIQTLSFLFMHLENSLLCNTFSPFASFPQSDDSHIQPKTSGSLNTKIFSFYPFAIHRACMPCIQKLCVHPAVIITLSTLLKSWIPLQIRQYLYFHLQRFCNQKEKEKKKRMYYPTDILLISNKHSWKMEVSLCFERTWLKMQHLYVLVRPSANIWNRSHYSFTVSATKTICAKWFWLPQIPMHTLL